jgi:dTDP-4-amino-4,6-dideoxygalactose transaminase
MKKLYFLGSAANYSRKQRLKHTFAIGLKSDVDDLKDYLNKRYEGARTIVTKNGRSALALALRANFEKGARIIVNGFTCYAVVEAVKAAGMEPVFADIDKKTLNFTKKTLEAALPADGIIIQNTLGNVVDIEMVEKFAEENDLVIIEDLAHCTGAKYADGREVGTVGVATALSFGKDKSIDTISGGAVIFRNKAPKFADPRMNPRFADKFRERLYPLFGAISRGLTRIHLGGVFMKFLVLTRQVQRSADNKLEMNRKIAKFEAKLALSQLQELEDEGPIRNFFLVHDRDELLKKLREAGYYFDGFWYEKPVSPARYYDKVEFPEDACPVAVEVASKIINVPTFYTEEELAPALKIINKYVERD